MACCAGCCTCGFRVHVHQVHHVDYCSCRPCCCRCRAVSSGVLPGVFRLLFIDLLFGKRGSSRTSAFGGEATPLVLRPCSDPTPTPPPTPPLVRHYTRILHDPVVEEVRVVHPPPVVQHYRVVHHFSDMWYRLRGHYCGPAVNWHLFA